MLDLVGDLVQGLTASPGHADISTHIALSEDTFHLLLFHICFQGLELGVKSAQHLIFPGDQRMHLGNLKFISW